MTIASRGFAGEPDALHRRSRDAARDAFGGSTPISIDDAGISFDEVLAEFDRRVALLDAEAAHDLRFSLADFAVEDRGSSNSRREESLTHVLRHAGPMPADVAEECVRRTLSALRTAHERRWNHGELSLDAFILDSCGAVRLLDVGRSQRAAWLSAADVLDAEGSDLRAFQTTDNRWDQAFVSGASDDFRRLTIHVVDPLLEAIDGGEPAWAQRLLRRLHAVDGAIGSVEDVDHAWRVIEASFDDDASSTVAASVEERPVAESSIDDLPFPKATFDADATSRIVWFWLCVVGGFAALAGTVAATVIAL